MVYLIHFASPYRHARHYIGWTESKRTLKTRLQHHADGRGSRLMQAVTRAGIQWDVVLVWPEGDRQFERKLHKNSHTRRLCPVCKSEESA